MNSFAQWPLSILALTFFLYFAEPVLVPFFLAILLAQLLVPVVRRMEKHIPSWLSILLSLLLVMVAVSSVVGIVSGQLAAFQKNAPGVQERLGNFVTSTQSFLEDHLAIEPSAQIDLLKQTLEGLVGAGGQLAVAALSLTVSMVGNGALIGILTFLMLFYRAHFRHYIVIILRQNAQGSGAEGVDRVLEMSQKYVAGLMSVIAMIGVFDTLGFLLIQSQFAVLFGMLGALAVLIPYVGILVVAPLCALLAWAATGSGAAAGGVLAVFSVIHFLEGNVITPYFVGHQVNINPLTSILAVLIGGEIWGPAGMLLFIPLTGMLQLTLEMRPGAKSFAKLIGSVEDKTPGRKRKKWLLF